MNEPTLIAPRISDRKDIEQSIFFVLTGARLFRVQAPSGKLAIEVMKHNIDQRRHEKTNPIISHSFVASYDANQLNYIVIDEKFQKLVCGEMEGKFKPRVTRELAQKFEKNLCPNLFLTTEYEDILEKLLAEIRRPPRA